MRISKSKFVAGLLADCLSAPCVVVSVMGPHAGEDVDKIFERKMADVRAIGQTFWLVSSWKVKPLVVQEMCRTSGTGYVVFIKSSGVPRPAIADAVASRYSVDGCTWQPLPVGLGPVTGNLGPRTKALVFNVLELCHGEQFDMCGYGEWPDGTTPLDTRIGQSTVCAVRSDMSGHPKKMRKQWRTIMACARLQAPFCVWVR